MMRKIIGLISVILLSIGARGEGESVERQAEEAYQAGKYAEAAALYRGILAGGQESASLYYNLGNCCYKAGENTQAILNYERALLLEPGNDDVRYNLQMAQDQVVDKIEVLPEFFIIRWFRSLYSCMSADAWGYLSIVLFVLFLGALAMFFYSPSVWMRKAGFAVGVVLLALAVAAFIFGTRQNSRLVNRDKAIVTTPSVTVKGAPDESGTSLFVIHEGLKVRVLEPVGEWVKVRLDDGNEGWVSKNDVEVI